VAVWAPRPLRVCVRRGSLPLAEKNKITECHFHPHRRLSFREADAAAKILELSVISQRIEGRS
jgi:hypothetical protein